ncbi:hypothetical protein FZEAL_228 [Fusarium zealandicum]|uniref:Zn(2)-C6 fungal-type domain-containing protein n=1 Tax=Fusarium zealandicum TaxID=1053134 RepID=A0A8H4UV43_9HYPO|nr:hypothetical protein FZEAL_228 [Fusarium zealandicum]
MQDNISSAVSSTGSPPPKRRRRRRARSCEQCRRRKIRCNMKSPCNECVRARAPMQCSYRDGSPGEEAAGAHQVRDLAPRMRPEGAGASQQITPDNGDNTALPSQDNSLPRPAMPPQLSVQTTPSSTSIRPHIPRLRNVPEKTKLFGQTHWLHTAEKFPISGKFHPVEVEPAFNDAKAELLETLKEARILRHALKKQNAATLDQPIHDLRETLPVKEACDELVRCYLRTLEPMYRIVHVPSFWKEYDRLWEHNHAPPVPTVFLMKLTLILAIGTTFKETRDIETIYFRGLAQRWIQNAQWWLTGPCEKSTYNLDGLQVFCLLLLARQTTFNCRGATSWLSSGSLLRAAATMGLHRDPKLFPGLSLFQKEFRARLWTTVLELSVQSCLDLGLPLNLSEADYDASSPSNFNDSDLESGSQKAPDPSYPTDSSLQLLLAQSLPLRIEVVRLLNDFRHEQAYEKAVAIGTQLRAACRDVAAFFHSIKSRDNNSGDRSTLKATEFHRKFMDIQLRRFIMFLHRDFMLQARSDSRFYLSRKACVEAALVIASSNKDADLSLPIQHWDEFSRLCLVGRGLFKGALSFDAMLILALEVITQVQDESVSHHEADVLDEMAKATRAPLIKVLEAVRDQLSHIITLGNTSLKRLLFANAHLAQIHALEAGQPAKQAIYEAITKTLRDSVVVLREIQAAVTPQESVTTMDSLTTDLFPLEVFSAENPMEWDISSLLGIPPMVKYGETQWPILN